MTTELLKKYIEGEASREEKEEVQLWIEADEENHKELVTLRTLYDITLGHLPAASASQLSNAGNKIRKFFLVFIQVAASVLITFGCTYYFLMNKISGEDEVLMQTLHIPAGQRAELTLTDGTRVWLNALTTLTFPNKFTGDSREVLLDGEGYFDVAPDTQKVFTVKTNDYLINALGTEFNVAAYMRNGYFETSLLEGSIEVISKRNTGKILLQPGERIYFGNGRLLTSSISHYDHFLWRKGILSFDHECIEDILGKLSLYFDIEIQNDNKKIHNMRYTGKFRTKDGVEHVLNVLKIPTGLRYIKDNEMNKIYIK